MLESRREQVISKTEKMAFEKFKIPEVSAVDTANPLLCAGPQRGTICHWEQLSNTCSTSEL